MHLDEDILVGRLLVHAELEGPVLPAEEVKGGALDLLAHRVLECGAVEDSLGEEDPTDTHALRGVLLRRQGSAQLRGGDRAIPHEALPQRKMLRH